MQRSKALARFRQERNAASAQWATDVSEWRARLAERARTLFDDLSAEAGARSKFRASFARQVAEKRRAFFEALEEARLAQVTRRAELLAMLVSSVNQLVVEFAQARTDRHEWAKDRSSEISRFLAANRESRLQISAAQASQLKAFRMQIASAARRACTEDF